MTNCHFIATENAIKKVLKIKDLGIIINRPYLTYFFIRDYDNNVVFSHVKAFRIYTNDLPALNFTA